jgi:glycosyl hydrolase family 123
MKQEQMLMRQKWTKVAYGMIGLIYLMNPVCTMAEKLNVKSIKTQNTGAVYYREDFETQLPLFKKSGSKVEKSSKIKVVDFSGGKVLKISGSLKWIIGKIKFPKPLKIPSDAMIMVSVMSEGKGGGHGVVANLVCSGKSEYCKTSMGLKNKEKGKWKKLIAYIGDYQPGKKEIELSGIIFAQRVDGGHEKPNDKGAFHTLYVDNIIIASGKAAAPIRKEARKIANIKQYNGALSYVLSNSQNATIWTSPSTAKVFKTQQVPKKHGKKIKISACRNEGESFQIIVSAKEDLKNVSLKLSPLKNADGAEIDLQNIRWHPIMYKQIRHRYFSTAMDSHWPEMLSWNRSIDIKKGINQPFWATINIPKNTPAGKYKGKIIVRVEDRVLTQCRIELTVFNATLPDSPKFRTNIQVWSKFLSPWYAGKERKVTEEMRRVLTEYKMYDANRFAQNSKETRNFLINKGMNALKLPFCGGHRGGKKIKVTKLKGALPFTEKYKKDFINKLRQKKSYYTQIGMADKAFLYVWDEPFGDFEVYKIIEWLGQISKETWPELKTFMAGPYNKKLGKYVNVFLEHYTTKKLQKQAQKQGVEFWWWGNTAMNVDLPGIDMRAKFGVESLDRNIKGAYAWGIAVWSKNNPWIHLDRYNANAYVFYPGNNKFSKSPQIVRSVTLEILRDGIEDYEYAHMIKEYIKNGKNKELVKECKKAYDKFINSIIPVYGLREEFSDVDRLKEARYEVAKCIEKIQIK